MTRYKWAARRRPAGVEVVAVVLDGLAIVLCFAELTAFVVMLLVSLPHLVHRR